VKLNVIPPHNVNLNIHPAALQAFARGVGPFISNITEPDFLQAVSFFAIHTAIVIIIMVCAIHACTCDAAKQNHVWATNPCNDPVSAGPD